MSTRTIPEPLSTRRPDASMELLNSILRDSVDPDYSSQSDGRRGSWPTRILVVLLCLVCGFGLTISALETKAAVPGTQAERAELIRRISDQDAVSAAQRSQVSTLQSDIGELQSQALGADSSLSTQRAALDIQNGMVPVTGPGMVLILNDSTKGNLLDQDLRQVVNGLWQSGAEAISINGHRLSVRTAIRQAGSAITVDYRSITPPYRIDAIGDPRALPGAFGASDGGVWLGYLRNNFGIRYDSSVSQLLSLPADPGLALPNSRRLG